MVRAGFFRSAGVRLAFGFAGLFAGSALALVLFLWWSASMLLDRQVEASIRADAQALSDRWEDGGLPALVAAIRDRLAENVDEDAIYLLTDSSLHPLAGNLGQWPAGVDLPDTSYERPVVRGSARNLALVKYYDLDSGLRLLIGRDIQARAALRDLLAGTLLWSLALAGLLGAGGAWLIQRLFRRMLSDLSATATAISAGDIARRVRMSGRGDEVDRLAETVNEMLDRMVRLMDGVRQVSNAIAHDLRTPIARARARLEDAAATATDTAQLRAALERAVADLDGVVAVFQALLRIAEIEAGARRSAFTTFDAGPVLADMAELYGAVAEERGLSLLLALPGPLPVHGDRALVQQAIANLLDNALKFSPSGSTVRLAGNIAATGVVVEVQDQGPGIPPADLVRAADRFYRAETARSTPGSGLGLALVQAVAQLHGGKLQLEDTHPGLRATLTLARET
jgi:signal transduction histidine kinase